MDFHDISILYHLFEETVLILQRLFIVVVAAFIAIRLKKLRRALRGAELKWRYRLLAGAIFGFLSIIGTHSGVLIDVWENGWSMDLSRDTPVPLRQNQAIVGFRDTMALVAGLIGGPWVGIIAGGISGLERYHLGGMAALASGFATFLLGVFAGMLRYLRPKRIATMSGVFLVAVVGTLLQRLLILLLVQPLNLALALSWAVVVPILIVNCTGCVLFFLVMRDLDRDMLESEANEYRMLLMQAELRALRAQVQPHFLNNTLNDLFSMFRTDSEKARLYVRKLADFFNYTRHFSGLNTIRLTEEADQVQRFLDLQKLGLGDKLQVNLQIDPSVTDCPVLPGCLLTLVENALKHGFKGRPAPYILQISAHKLDGQLILQVQDNGRGILPDRLAKLGKQIVESENSGGGVALYQLLQTMNLVFTAGVELSFASTLEQGATVTLKQEIQRMI